MIRYFLFAVAFLMFLGTSLGQSTISGYVHDGSESMPFSTVKIASSSRGTLTDMDGNFLLTDVAAEDTLVISFVGFVTQKIRVGAQTEIDVEMLEDYQSLDDVVVVGYGTQEKINVTGSVSSVDASKIQSRGVTNVSNILAGQTPGLTVLQRGGSPGRNEGELRIRGIGTLGGSEKNSPLIIVDGIETGSLSEINPDDIANVSVLKDASASAIYGVRAANGVVIVTTKRGEEGRPSFNYSFQFGVSSPTNLPEKLNAAELAELLNEAQSNEGLSTRFFSQEDIDLFNSGESPFTHANSNQVDEIFDQQGIRQVHNLSASGGSATVRYNMSLGYTDEQGLMSNTALKRYNFRTNLDAEINKKLALGMNLAGSQRQITDPAVGVGGVIHRAYREWATDPITLEDGEWALPNFGISQGINHNALALLKEGGLTETVDSRFTGTFFTEFKPWKSLTIRGQAATVQDFNRRKGIVNVLELYNVDQALANTSTSEITEGRDNISDINLQLFAKYEENFGKHGINTLLGYNLRNTETILTILNARDLRSNRLDQINAADLTQDNIFGNSVDYRLISYFGRVNYSFDDKYLFEGNLRYDGTSRFPKENRFAYFPSFSLGWRVSEEDFFNVNWVDQFKFRASWGQLGNQEIGDYRFINTYGFNETAFLGNTEQSGSAERIPLGNPDIQWETTQVYNYGLDLVFLKGALGLSGDYFIRKTSDVLIQRPLPAVFGSGNFTGNFPFVNAASTENRGYEISANYKMLFGGLKIRYDVNFSYVETEITDLAGTDQPGFSVGDPIANIYGYDAIGIFQNQDEVDAHADQSAIGATSQPGDLKYRDFSGPDGQPDGIVDAFDRKNLGSYFPTINYGTSLNLQYKNFDFNMLWQGVADVKAEIGGRQRQPFFLGSSPWKQHLDRAIINREGIVSNPDARYPRTLTTGNTKNYLTSSWWVESTSFIKLRNAQLGYTISDFGGGWSEQTKLRIYFSGENLLVFTKFEGFDPEIPTTGDTLPLFSGNGGYPVTRTYLVGMNLTF